MYTIRLGLFVLECNIDIFTIIKGILGDFLNIYISIFDNFVNFWTSELVTSIIISITNLYLLGICLYFLTCLYFSCKCKKLLFVGAFYFIRYLFISLVLLIAITCAIRLLIYFEVDELVYYCPKDIYYHIVLFLFVSYSLAINWNLYNLFSIFIRGISIYILRLGLILIFPSLESFLTLNLLFLLLPGLDFLIQELFQSLNIRLDNIVFMYNSWYNSGPSMGGNVPGGSNNGGNNGGNNPGPFMGGNVPGGSNNGGNNGNNSGTTYSGISYPIDENSVINDPLDHHGRADCITLSKWADFWGIPKQNIALDPSVFYSSPVYGSTFAKIICRQFVLPIKADDLVFIAEIMNNRYILSVDKLRAVPLWGNASITIFKFMDIPNSDVIPYSEDLFSIPVKYSTGQGLNGVGSLAIHSVIRIARYPLSNTLWVDINGSKELYDPNNMNHWGKDLFFKKIFYDDKSPWIKLGETNDFINFNEDKRITSPRNLLADSLIFRPYVNQISAAFQAERDRLSQNIIVID